MEPSHSNFGISSTKQSAVQPPLQIVQGNSLSLSHGANLGNLVSVQTPVIRLADMALPDALCERLKRVLLEQRQQRRLREHGLQPGENCSSLDLRVHD